MESCCRICSRSDEFRRFPLFAVAEVSQEIIANMITSCTDTQVSGEDGLPQQICPDCLITLSLAYSFRRLCRRTDAKFRECFRESAPSQTAEHQQQLSQISQPHDDSTYENITSIKEEVEFYDYECEVPPQENQWVIQNPRTIREGAMTVVHNSAQYYEQADERGGGQEIQPNVVTPMVAIGQGQVPAELGEPSTSFQKSEKLKKKLPIEPERFSKRIRQENPNRKSMTVDTPDWSIGDSGSQVVSNPAQQRCEYCKKKMKKSYKHRNGKCLIMKNKNSFKNRCVYCHMTFVRSTSIPNHLRNSCRVYREVCKMRGIDDSEPFGDHTMPATLTSSETLPTSTISPVHSVTLEAKIDKNSILGRPKLRSKCDYCEQIFTVRGNLIKHQRERCKVLRKMSYHMKKQCIERTISGLGPSVEQTTAPITKLPEKLLRVRQPSNDSSVVSENQLDRSLIEEETQCVYCTQMVSKKSRFLHHNGRCVLGRTNAEHPCPYCPMAFSSRGNLLRHQRERCQQYHQEQSSESVQSVVKQDSGAAKTISPKKSKQLSVEHPKKIKQPAVEPPKKFKQPPVEPPKKSKKLSTDHKDPEPDTSSLKSVVKRSFCKYCQQWIKNSDRLRHKDKRCINFASVNNQSTDYFCGYCRKGFANRDTLVEHQRVCTARKLHKQVKCQHCGMTISNRGNLRKHQKVYCKSVPRSDDVKMEVKPEVESPKRQYVKKIKEEKKENVKVDESNKPNQRIKAEPSTQRKDKKNKQGDKLLHPCVSCKRRFKTAGYARRHMNQCGVKSTSTHFVCRYCSDSFSCRSNMYRHQKYTCKRYRADKTIANNTVEDSLESANKALVSSTPKPTKRDPKEHNRFLLLAESEADSSSLMDDPLKLPESHDDVREESNPTVPPKFSEKDRTSPELHESQVVDNNNSEGEKDPTPAAAQAVPETTKPQAEQASTKKVIDEREAEENQSLHQSTVDSEPCN
ncbi:uncharacterized protein LOC131685141 [Topomyia yanbarensis]|uniref:uncharacterized protein LOC131685141 n=1 Tax=Topomyia yanbarensis TaxID=2498891 RepID=UPI00273C3436|nr:uncharacterized protein LOC131685141 [Topomyia yanbarensis]